MTGITKDAASEAWYWPDMAAMIDGDGETEAIRIAMTAEIEKRARRQASAVCSHVICTILGYGNVRLALTAYCIAHNIGGLTQESIEQQAKRLGVTKQALSKEVTWFRDVYDIEAMGALKTNLAREHYRAAQKMRDTKKKPNETGKHFNFNN